MKWIISSIMALIFVALSVSAQAFDVSIVRAEMAKGQFQDAYSLAEKSETAEGLALAAESLLTEILLGEAMKNKKQAKTARKLAQAALDLDPMHQNARLQFAVADGFITRETGDVSAWMKKLPQKTYGIIQSYRTDFPDDVRGDALLGAWHLAIVRKAGEKNANKWFEASIKDGQYLFEKALEKSPDDIIIGINYAFALIVLDEEEFSDLSVARKHLEYLSRLEPKDYLDQTLFAFGKEALSRLDNRENAQDYTAQFLDGKRPE